MSRFGRCSRRMAGVGIAAALATLAVATPPLEAQLRDAEAPCAAAAVPPTEPGVFVPLPRGDVFCSPLADPKEPHSFASYLWGRSPAPFDTRIGAVGIGDRFGVVRLGGTTSGNGVQLSVSASIFAQFDLDTPSFDLINADYVIGLPLTFRAGGFSGRARVYHQSSHLGDEFLLRGDEERENLSFNAAELIVSQEFGRLLRGYAGGQYLFTREPEELEPGTLQAGVELHPRAPLLRFGVLGSARPVAALDVKAAEEQGWSLAWSGRAGFEVGRGRTDAGPERRWSVLAEVYQGPAPYGQFYRGDIRYLGVGLHFAP